MRSLISLCLLLACAPGAPSGRADSQLVQQVDRNDPAMTAAIAEARATVGGFIARLEHGPAAAYAAVKAPVTQGDEREHLWLSPVRVTAGRFEGIVANVPEYVHGLAMGDTLRLSPDSISDWMLIDRDTVYGGYTVYVLRDRMSARNRRAFDSTQGVHFGPTARRLP